MTTASPEDGCAVVQRGCCLGGAWGALIGIVLLAFGAVADGRLAEMAFFPLAALVGAVMGAVVGTVSGMALGLGEQMWAPSDCQRRAVGFVASALASPFCILWFAGNLEAGALPVLLVIACVGATAGALLAPRAVHGRPRKGDSA